MSYTVTIDIEEALEAIAVTVDEPQESIAVTFSDESINGFPPTDGIPIGYSLQIQPDGSVDWGANTGAGDMLSINNLSDLDDPAIARQNLGLGNSAVLNNARAIVQDSEPVTGATGDIWFRSDTQVLYVYDSTFKSPTIDDGQY